MMKLIKYLFLTITLIWVCGCAPKAEDIKILSVNNVELINLKSSSATIKVDVTAKNSSSSTVTLQSADFDLIKNSKKIAHVTLSESISVKKRAQGDALILLDVKFGGLLGAASLITDMNSSFENIFVTGEITVKAGAFTKKLKVKELPVKSLMEEFDIKLK